MHTVELMCYCWTVSALLPACSELRPFRKFYHCHRRSAITSIFSQSYCRNNRETESLPRNPSAFPIVPKAMTSFAWHASLLILYRKTAPFVTAEALDSQENKHVSIVCKELPMLPGLSSLICKYQRQLHDFLKHHYIES